MASPGILDFKTLVDQDRNNGNRRVDAKVLNDVDIGMEFRKQRINYFRNMPPRENIFKMASERQRKSQLKLHGLDGAGGMNSMKLDAVKIQAPNTSKPRDQKDLVEMFLEFTAKTSEFIPVYQARHDQIKEMLKQQLKENELRKFEDEDYLNNFIDDMRAQISEDLQHLEQYYPYNLKPTNSKLYLPSSQAKSGKLHQVKDGDSRVKFDSA